jgi:hypothetical protein
MNSNLEYARLMLGGSPDTLGSDVRILFAPVSPSTYLPSDRGTEKLI